MNVPVGDIDIAPFRVGSIVQIESKPYMITDFELIESCRMEQTLGGLKVALAIETTVEISCIATAASETPRWGLLIFGPPEPFKVADQWYRLNSFDADHDAGTMRVVIQRAYWISNGD
jgi:hypothetical protein